MIAEAEAAIDKILTEKPAGEDITLREIEQWALSGGKDFRDAVLGNLVAGVKRKGGKGVLKFKEVAQGAEPSQSAYHL